MKIGERVIFNTVLAQGDYPGEIIEINGEFCTVKLDCQDVPVEGVLYFDVKPEIVNSAMWQICWPGMNERS